MLISRPITNKPYLPQVVKAHTSVLPLYFSARLHTNAPAKAPRFLYHLTTEKAWEKIQARGALLPVMEENAFGLLKNPLSGVFTFDIENFSTGWGRDRPDLGSAFQGILMQLQAEAQRSKDPNFKLVLLKIPLDAIQDDIIVRDLSRLYVKHDLKGAFQNRMSLDAYLSRAEKLHGRELEFVIQNPVPVARGVQVAGTVASKDLPSALDLHHYHYNASQLSNAFLNSDAYAPEQVKKGPKLHKGRFMLIMCLKHPVLALKSFYLESIKHRKNRQKPGNNTL